MRLGPPNSERGRGLIRFRYVRRDTPDLDSGLPTVLETLLFAVSREYPRADCSEPRRGRGRRHDGTLERVPYERCCSGCSLYALESLPEARLNSSGLGALFEDPAIFISKQHSRPPNACNSTKPPSKLRSTIKLHKAVRRRYLQPGD
jgi:hypothetical protein